MENEGGGRNNTGSGNGSDGRGDDGISDKPKEFKIKQKLDEYKEGRRKTEEEWHAKVKVKILNFMVFMFAPLCFFLFVIGSYDFFRNIEENKCQMTFMYEYPQYIKIQLDSGLSRTFPVYNLYAYAEGKHIETVRNVKFTGIPVLYLPGNAGSYKQVRSFASVALRRWLKNKTPFHFDFFSIDFNEEVSGMYGYVLERQSEYLRHAVKKITSLYEDHHHIVIIGHSMGGIVAKSVNVEEATVQLIYTVATPHLHPPLIADPEMDLFYYYVHRNWTHVAKQDTKNPVTLVSVAGGDRDFLVSGKLTHWSQNTIHTSTPSIPTVWASTDHLCIVWCKQLVMVVVRSLFDLVDFKANKKYYAISESSTMRSTVLNYHFKKRTSGKSIHDGMHPAEIDGESPIHTLWNEILTHSWCQSSVERPTHIMIPRITFQEKVKGPSSDYQILVTTSNTESKNWVLGCKSQRTERSIKYCNTLENLSSQTVLLPSVNHTRKIIHLDYDLISKFSHLVVQMEPTHFQTCVDVEVYKVKERTHLLGTAIKDTQNAMFYNFTYPVTVPQSKLFDWKVHVKLVTDENGNEVNCLAHYDAVGLFRNGNFQTHNFFQNESLRIRFLDTSETSTGQALLYLDKKCKYSIKVELDYVGSAGQLFRVVVKLIPAYVASIILMSLFFQNSKDWANFHRVLLTNAAYLCIVPGFLVALSIVFLPTDYRQMLTEAEYSAILPMICYFIAYAVVLLISLGFWVVTLGFGNGLHSIVTRFLVKKLGIVPEKVTDLALTLTMEKFPLSIAILIIAIAMSTSGAMGLVVGLILHILKIFKGYEGILEDLVRGKIESVSDGLSPINFQTHCALLWLVVASINVPSLMYFINSFRFGEIPNWDLSLYICLMLSPTISILWQGFVPDFHPTMWSMQRYLCYFMGIVVVVFGSHRIYLISLIIVLVQISLAICQLISRLAIVEEESENSNSNENVSRGERTNTDAPPPPTAEATTTTSSMSTSQQKSELKDSKAQKKGGIKEDLEDSMSSSSVESSSSED